MEKLEIKDFIWWSEMMKTEKNKAKKIAMTKYQGQAKQYCLTDTQLENVLVETAQLVAREVLSKVREGSIHLAVGTDQQNRRWIELPDLERYLQTLEASLNK
jgi:hypothetical protein